MTEIKLFATDKSNNWVYFSNNNHPNIKEMLDNCDFKNKFLFIINVFCCKIKEKPNAFINLYPEIYEYQHYAKTNNLKFIVVFEMCNEAPNFNKELDYQINFIKQKCNLEYEDILTLTGAHYSDTDLIKHVQVLNIVGNDRIFTNTNYKTLPKHHFVSLARMAKSHRVATTVEILERKLEKFGYCSCGSGYYINPNENDFSYLPENLKNKFPMYIDGPIVGQTQDQYKMTNTAMEFAFVNIVMETSYDKNFSYFTFNNITWNLPFTTEKTMKPFAWGQVPIFITPIDNDLCLRNLGFDLFDDIIDQSYNQEPNPYLRIKQAVDELEKICMQPIEHWQEFKTNNLERFENNRVLAYRIVNSRNVISGKNLQKVLDTM